MKNQDKKNKMINLKLMSFLFMMFIVFSLFSFAYYTNTNKFFQESRKDDGLAFNTLALERENDDFITNGCGSGTMLDTVTGLCWQKDMGNSRVWSTDNSYSQPTWSDINKNYSYPSGKANYPAFSYCDDLVLGDNDDWRMPSSNELMTLIDEIGALGSTCAKLLTFGFTSCNVDYRSSDEYKTIPTAAWIVQFNVGKSNVATAKNTNGKYILCVRNNN